MLTESNIKIVGQIGTTPATETTPAVKGVELVDVIAQAKAALDSGATELMVGIYSPGGYVDVGNQIFNYLNSLKSDKVKVYTQTIPNPETGGPGLVGSIATKIFLAGEQRLIGAADEFFIHNPWTNPGPSDASRLLEASQNAQAVENEFRAFYCKMTNNTEEALRPLMDAETSLTAQQAVSLHFATAIKPSQTNLLALITKQNRKTTMSTQNKTIGQKLDAILASITSPSKVKALTLIGSDGTQYFVDAPDVASSKDKLITLGDVDGDSTGTPAPDGTVTMQDGSMLTISGGKVTAVKVGTGTGAPAAPAAPGVSPDAFSAFKKSTEDTLAKITEALEKLAPTQASVITKEALQAEILALKKEIGVRHTPPRVQLTKEQRAEKNRELTPIQRKMRGIKEEDI